MKKIFAILTFLIVAFNSFSQNVQSNNSFILQPTTASKTSLRVKGDLYSDSGFRVPVDNRVWTPIGSGWIRYNSTIGALQYWNEDSVKWLLLGSGGGLPPSLATLSPGYGLIGVTYDPYLTNQTWLVDTASIASITYVNNFFADTSFIFPFNAQERTNDPPASPADSTWWLIGDTPTGIWVTHENQLAQRIGSGYVYYDEPTSTIVNVITPSTQWQKVGDIWVLKTTFIINNGNLIGLPIYIGTKDSQDVFLQTHDTARFELTADGKADFLKYKSTSIPSSNYAKFDTATGELIWDSTFNLYAVSPLRLSHDTLYCVGCSGFANAIDSLRNNSGVLEARKGGVFIPQFTLPTGGTVTSFSAGTLSPLFTTSVATSTTTPALTFAQSNTTQFTVLGRIASGSGAYSFVTADSTLIQGLHSENYYNTKYQAIGTYVTAVTGSGNIASSGGTTPNITFTGVLPIANGGTNISTYTTGDILYASATNVLSKLPIGTAKQKLSVVGGLPAWVDTTASGSSITPAALTKTDDANVTLTLGGTPATSLLQATSLTLGWTGTLAATRGGTGTGTVATGDLLYGSGTNAWSKLSIGTTGQHLVIVGGLPVWRDTTAATAGTITGAGNLSPLFTTGVSGANITFTLSNAAANTVLGNATSGSTTPSYGQIVNGQITNATIVATTKLSATGTPSSSNFLRGDNTWATPSAGSAFTRQIITSGSSGTVTGGNYIVTIDPAATLAAYTLTMPASPSDLDVVEVDFGGTLTSGIIVTALTISANSGQTILDNTPPTTAGADNTVLYRYRTANTTWYRFKP